jgi:hypothetical protein
VWTEFYGKYLGCKYWSEEALKFKDKLKPNPLIHEHLVPKKILIDFLMNKENRSPKEINNFLKKLCVGVVITKSEDQKINDVGLRSKMPDGWDYCRPSF